MKSEINLNEEFGYNIFQTIIKYNLKNNIEIGSWDGEGSTRCFVEAMKLLGGDKRLLCIEIIKEKFEILKDRYKDLDFVTPLNMSSISYKSMIYKDYNDVRISKYNKLKDMYPDYQIKSWFDRDIESLKQYKTGALDNLSKSWDSVLIDGGEFTGYSEYLILENIVNVIFLDDVHNAFKCNQIYHELLDNKNWNLLMENESIRNGYAIFKKNIL